MKRTSATASLASALARRLAAGEGRRWKLAVAATVTALSLFLLGRATAPVPDTYLQAVVALQSEVHRQQGEVDRLAAGNRQDVNALAARLAELQAASTRLDALGERLAQMGQLSLDEFDFTTPAPVGGPQEYAVGTSGDSAIGSAIDTLRTRLRRQATELDALQALMANRQLESDLTPAGWPVRKGWISSRFGERTDPFTGERSRHNGLDFSGTRGTEVLSVASGVVTWASSRADYGKTVEIDHGNGYVTRYAHNDAIAVHAGEHVTAGQVIARMGSTGRASGPHVHFEVLKNGARVNPSRFVSQLR